MRVVFFDIDGTLLRTGGASRESLESAFFQTFGCKVRNRVDYHGRPDRAIAASLMTVHGIPDSDASWTDLRAAYLQLLPHSLARRRGSVLPGVRRLLDTLRRQSDVVVGLITGNTRASARIKLGHYGLLEMFGSSLIGGFGDEVYERDEVARLAIRSVQEIVGWRIPPEHVWVVGDTPRDILSARAIGARALAVATGHFAVEALQEYGPDQLVPNLNALFDGACPLWK